MSETELKAIIRELKSIIRETLKVMDASFSDLKDSPSERIQNE